MIADTVEKRITKSEKNIEAQISESETRMSETIAKLDEKIEKVHELLAQHLSRSDDNRAATNAISQNLTEQTSSRRDSQEEHLDESYGYTEEDYQTSQTD